MRKSFYLFFFAIILSALFGCSLLKDSPTRKNGTAVKNRQPADPSQNRALGSDASLPLEQRVNDLLSQTRIPLNTDYHLLQVINTNLDIDQVEEQIIVFKKKNDPTDRINLLVVDFDNVRNTYVGAWQGETQGTNNRSFSVYLNDVIGDHVVSILCFGRNNKGEQTLDIFRKTQSPTGLGLFYASIASIAANGSIEIEDRTRSEAYQLLQKNDDSFSVVLYSKDPDSTNISDLIKTTYFWSHPENKYVPGKTEKILGQIVAEKQLTDLFKRESEEFEKFLSGPWFLTLGSEGVSKVRGMGEIIHFDPKARKIIFYNGEIQEVFNWSNSYRTIYRGLYINCANEAIASITKQISLSVTGMDSLDLQVKGGEGWDGTYKRLSKDLQYGYLASRKTGVKLSSLQLSGLYKNETGLELYFAAPSFTLRENNKEVSGGFVVYSFGGDILEMKILKENGLVDSTKTYRVFYQEDIKGKRTTKNLVLQPAVVNLKGVDVKTSGTLRFQQILEAAN